ncbi:cell wall hydrolase [Sphingomonas mollis]|uniref:Cell wall hydrolase n=1 Tax=Sphingomonas mollis TaxID=2795726 RepID=A0ABS0XMX6_9SPHN|nr:cell wall hydrolase [Sphingomonas sp. BT553]
MTAFPSPTLAVRASTILIAALSVAVPALVVRYAPPIAPQLPRSARLHRPPQRVVPATVVPPVEPVELVDLSLDDARAFNASVPFSRDANPAARRFVLQDASEDLARATDCLAAAVIYEAGNDPDGQRAVAQVVLNRLRHPAFPKTVCGVVFEGQERKTGCQFTFTCDGALTRWAPPAAMWTRARTIATAALTGAVYRPVGYATHYHTDWVVPYWQSSLDKIAAVKSHLFFRWSGWWGTPPAFNRHVDPVEPIIQKLAAFSDAHRLGGAVATAEAVSTDAAALAQALTAGLVAPPTTSGEPDSFLAALPANVSPDAYPQLAEKACGSRDRCRYLGWTDAKAVPKTAALDPQQIASMAFSYLRDRPASLERTLWNCTLFPHTRPGGCMRRQPTPVATPAPTALKTPQPSPTRGPLLLDGVRRASPRPTEPGAAPATAP